MPAEGNGDAGAQKKRTKKKKLCIRWVNIFTGDKNSYIIRLQLQIRKAHPILLYTWPIVLR